VLARRGVVAASEPLAAQAGLRMLQQGGNAADAAIATAIALTVVEPTCNGLGGDAFGLIWDGAKLHGLNGSGRALNAHERSLFTKLGLEHVPPRGWLPVTVPGQPAAWADMHGRFGKLPFEALFEPAIEYATNGFPVAPVTAQRWRLAAELYAAGHGNDPALRGWRDTFTDDGRAPVAGDSWALPDLANTFRDLAATRCESFYRGKLAERIAGFAATTGGYITEADLAAHQSTWDEPIHARYRGYDVWQMPPNTQGIAALTALNILEGFELSRYPRDSADSYHLQIEACKLALSDVFGAVADPRAMTVDWRAWLGGEHAANQRARVGDRASQPVPSKPPASNTVYLCAADESGMMVSFMQSNYAGWMLGFGSGVVVPGTGIALHSRGCGFTLAEQHPNVIAPGKRAFHTLSPSFLSQDGRAIGPFGIMGGPMQPQGCVQFVVNQLDYGMNPQAALDAPRFQWVSGNRVEVELATPGHVMQGLVERRHDVQPCVEFASIPPRLSGQFIGSGGMAGSGDFGKAQIIRRLANGNYVAGSDGRADGCAAGY
jgi:gamma-glutamyltranspeptidase/glutathione hydrolase